MYLADVTKTAVAANDVNSSHFTSPVIHILEKMPVDCAQMHQVEFAVNWGLREFQNTDSSKVALVLIK